MKKGLAAFLAVVSILMLWGCGKKEEEGTSEELNAMFKNDIQMLQEITTEATTQRTTTATTTTADTTTKAEVKGELSGLVILVDAGHGKADYSKKEPVAPGSSEMKAAFVAGTSGENQTEAELNLKVSKKLQSELERLGARVYMTRTGADAEMSNVERAEYGNDLDADMVVRIHANGSDDKSVHGILTMVPGTKHVDNEVYDKSLECGTIVQRHMIKQTGAKDAGIQKRNDMTGFNWSEVPVILVEMGFMTNREEDRLLESSAYQDKIVKGIVDGLTEYFD